MTDRIVTLRDNSNNKVYPVGFAPAGAVTTSMYTDASITTPKLADGSVTTSKLANNSVTADKLAPGAFSVDDIYPVGSIYMSVNSTNPGTLFGGTWEQLKDVFLLTAGDTYTAGTTGGSDAHTHNWAIQTRPWYGALIGSGSELVMGANYDTSNARTFGGTNVTGDSSKFSSTRNSGLSAGATANAGGGTTAFEYNTSYTSNLPPYLTVYAWKRTA